MTTTQKLMLAILGMAMLTACEDDESSVVTPNAPVSVQFGSNISIPENEAAKEVVLTFSRDAIKDGIIVLDVTTEFGDSFTTMPAVEDGEIALEVSKGESDVSFSIQPTDNTLVDAARTATFSIKEVSDGFKTGTKTTLDLNITDNEVPPSEIFASFAVEADSMMENASGEMTLRINLTEPAPAGARVIIEQTGERLYFSTFPAANENNQITVLFGEGADYATFTFRPYDNNRLFGHKSATFKILATDGALAPGEKDEQSVKIIDDELYGKAKSFESFGGSWSAKHTYEYDEDGRISKVHWENRTPGLREGAYTYTYAENGLIANVNHHEYKDVRYIQENGMIVRSETIQSGELRAYSVYDYDPAGNVGGRADYWKQPSGEFLMTDIYVYLHYDNGDLYKTLNYKPDANGGEPELFSEQTYEEYMGVNNPFPLMELLPNINSQLHWPVTYQVVDPNQNQSFRFNYQTNDQGQIIRRTVAGLSDVTHYSYY